MRILPIALLVTLLGAASAHASVKPPTVPTDLQPPAGHTVFALGHAAGVQIYRCNGSAWALTGPRANLYDKNGNPKWTHSAGPTWQHKDGSTVVGQLYAPPVPITAGAIPWLLLRAASTAPGADGDKMVKTTFIQRVNTTGGLAPAASTCTTAGATAEVPYTADYYFWKAK
jgi:hypothetical protein